jgi:hypothetical protein
MIVDFIMPEATLDPEEFWRRLMQCNDGYNSSLYLGLCFTELLAKNKKMMLNVFDELEWLRNENEKLKSDLRHKSDIDPVLRTWMERK